MSMLITQTSQAIGPTRIVPAPRRRRETAATLTWKPSRPQPLYRRALARLPVAAFMSVMACGVYGSTIVRGAGAGSHLPKLLIINALLVAPAVGILLGMLVGYRRRQCVGAIGLLLVMPPLAAEAYGTLEERMFVAEARGLPDTAPTVFKISRWWPNTGSYLYYDPWTGELGGGD